MSVIKANLPVFISYDTEAQAFVAFCPVLDLATQGDNIKEAQEMFDEALDLFLEYHVGNGTLAEVLIDLGWNLGETIQLPIIEIKDKSNQISQEIIKFVTFA